MTGAPNIREGDKVPFAFVGANLFDPYAKKMATLKPANIRGIRSEGMVCSEKELLLSEEHTGIMILPADAPLGAPLADYLGDSILDLEVTPNRPDLLSMLGVAHEVAALTGQKVREPDLNYPEGGENIQSQAKVRIDDPDLCSRYTASLITNVTVGPSPKWLRDRLTAAGMRPINNIVDITNYVMLEYGQPLHAFDYDKISQATIIVRRARSTEVLVTLDGEERTLDQDMLAIADYNKPVALAGVMGGANSEISVSTSSILLESANFSPGSVRRTASRLRMRSEASMRFERGISPELPIFALRRATQLIVELAAGSAAKGVIDVYPEKREPVSILLTTQEVKRELGLDISLERVQHVLSALDFTFEVLESMPPGAEKAVALGSEGNETKGLLVTPPYFRTDITLVEDVVEELARVIGYDAIPMSSLSGSMPPPVVDAGLQLVDRVREILVGCGLQEIVTYSLFNLAALDRAFVDAGIPVSPPIRVANPMTSEYENLRTSLRPGLFQTTAANLRHEEAVHIFEIGRIFLFRDDDLPDERRMLVGALAGGCQERTWLSPSKPVDFFDVKGVIEVVLGGFGIAASYEPCLDPGLQAGRTAKIMVGRQAIGVLGEVDPRVLANFEIEVPSFLFEIDIEALLGAEQQKRRFVPISRYPGIERDIAVIVDSEISMEKVRSIILKAPLAKEVRLFDVYSGSPLPTGTKSLAFSV
ncbi:MAG: phenylalanine--tRNA ligase subunit beta, partial [Dehalococcoidia bacterium]|nr:phenylalanine--tRNA ligase subunit beta [Dehalococcoidia bacterium]